MREEPAAIADPDPPRDLPVIPSLELPGDPDAIDLPAVFDGLKKIGFDGWATVMCDCLPGMDPRELSRRWHAALAPLR